MKNELEVICYTQKFKDAYKTLNVAWIEKYFRVEKKDLEQLNHPESCIGDGGQIFFIIDQDEAIATCAVYKMTNEQYELAKMAVRPDYQGRGLANLLMEKSEQWVREQGGNEMLILSNTLLSPAITLYKKHGYVTTKLGPNPDYERCNIEMKKQL
jgi:GNAT superfamily N-acetyltransferase